MEAVGRKRGRKEYEVHSPPAQGIAGKAAPATLHAIRDSLIKLAAARAKASESEAAAAAGARRDPVPVGTRITTATICPSEVARALHRDEKRWRAAMPSVRAVAIELAAAGIIAITQRGVVVDPATARGPIRIVWVRTDAPPPTAAPSSSG